MEATEKSLVRKVSPMLWRFTAWAFQETRQLESLIITWGIPRLIQRLNRYSDPSWKQSLEFAMRSTNMWL